MPETMLLRRLLLPELKLQRSWRKVGTGLLGDDARHRRPKARAILMGVLRAFALTPDGDSYRISGALNLSAVVGPGVSEKWSSGGPLPFPS